MFLHIINYAVRILIIVIGIVLLSGLLFPPSFEQSTLFQVMGAVFILWGIYRVITYHNLYKRYYKEEDKDE